MGPDFRPAGQWRGRRCSISSAATITCAGATMSMQWASDRAAQLRIDQRHDAADRGDAEPDRQIFRPVRHHQANRLALGEVLVERPARVAVAALDERAIGEGSAFAEISAAASPRPCAISSIAAGKMRRGLPAIGAVASARAPSRRARCRRRRGGRLRFEFDASHVDESHVRASPNKVNFSLRRWIKFERFTLRRA